MKAIILAAGIGSRLKKITQNKAKCMVEVNGESLIERALKQLDKKKLEEIIIVTGYKEKILKEFIEKLNIKTKLKFYNNEIYDKTNNIYSLFLTKEELINNDIILLESDLIFEEKLLDNLINNSFENLAVVSEYEPWMDGTCVKLDKNNNIIEFISGQNFDFKNTKNLYKTVNIYKLSKEFNTKYYIPFLEAYMSSKGTNQYYESVFETIIKIAPNKLKAEKIDDIKWYEIDDKQDLNIAESLFAPENEKLSKYETRYGGYWRYPKLLDFCYLVNPYFPPQKMIDELKMNFETLLTQYPSGLKVNNLLASKYFDVKEKYIVVGNGAAELIKGLLKILNGKLGIIRPTFEEYPNRYENETVVYNVESKGFRYSAKDIIDFFNDKNIENLILINPDNPSGNYILKNDLFRILEWSLNKNIKIVLDESFVDFSTEENSSFIKDEILEKYKNLIVVKSISKSYGIPGIRLGVVTTSDTELIDILKKEVSIWNINSFAEYYMQIFGKYEKKYKESLSKIKVSREKFVNELKEIKELEVYDSQANYILIKILEKINSRNLSETLLNDYDILIKDLKGKKGINNDYIRIAVRDEKDNNKCLEALKSIFKKRSER